MFPYLLFSNSVLFTTDAFYDGNDDDDDDDVCYNPKKILCLECKEWVLYASWDRYCKLHHGENDFQNQIDESKM